MAYLLVSDLITRFGAEELAQLADRGQPRLVTVDLLTAAAAGDDMAGWSPADSEATAATLVVLGQAIADAESAIDGYLASRYATPLATPPAVVKRLACDIARYYLYDDHATEAVTKRYDAAIAFFRDVSAGKVTLGPEAQSEGSGAAGGGTVEMVSGGRVFSRPARGL